MSTVSEVDAHDRGSSCGGSSDRSGVEPGPDPAAGSRDACSNDASMLEPQRSTSQIAVELTDMPLSRDINVDGSAVREVSDGRQLDERTTCSGGGMEGHLDASTVTGGSRIICSEAPRPTGSANMLSSGEEDNRVGVSKPAAISAPGACVMLSAEAQPSGQGSAVLKSGVTDGSMGIDGGSASMSAADAGSVSLANGLDASHLRASESPEAGNYAGSGEGKAQHVDEDLRDADGEDESCEVGMLLGSPPLDNQPLTDDEARLILGAQVELAVLS